jgi:hypothetical protein
MEPTDLQPFGAWAWRTVETTVALPSGRRAIRVYYRPRGADPATAERSFLFTPAEPGDGSREAIERAIETHAAR